MIDKNHSLWEILSKNTVPDAKSDWVDLSSTKLTEPCSKNTILLGNQLSPQAVLKYFIDLNAYHLVQQNKEFLNSDIYLANALATNQKNYFDKNFSYFFPDITRKSTILFSHENDKKQLIKEMESYLSEDDPISLKESSRAVLEELYMNALLSAPREAVKRNLKVTNFETGLKAQMHFVRTKNKFLIACEDPFGALNPVKLLQRMHEVYLHGAGTAINLEKEGGAGLGCVIMLEHSSDLILGVMPGQKSLVSCLIPLGLNYKKKEGLAKSLHRLEFSA